MDKQIVLHGKFTEFTISTCAGFRPSKECLLVKHTKNKGSNPEQSKHEIQKTGINQPFKFENTCLVIKRLPKESISSYDKKPIGELPLPIPPLLSRNLFSFFHHLPTSPAQNESLSTRNYSTTLIQSSHLPCPSAGQATFKPQGIIKAALHRTITFSHAIPKAAQFGK